MKPSKQCAFLLDALSKNKHLLTAKNSEIASYMQISESTAKRHLSELISLGYLKSERIGQKSRKLTVDLVLPAQKRAARNAYTYYTSICINTYTGPSEPQIVDKSVDNFPEDNLPQAECIGRFAPVIFKKFKNKMKGLGVLDAYCDKALSKTKLSEEKLDLLLGFYYYQRKHERQQWAKVSNPGAYVYNAVLKGFDESKKMMNYLQYLGVKVSQENKSSRDLRVEMAAKRNQSAVENKKRLSFVKKLDEWKASLSDEERIRIEGDNAALKKPNLITHFIENIL